MKRKEKNRTEERKGTDEENTGKGRKKNRKRRRGEGKERVQGKEAGCADRARDGNGDAGSTWTPVAGRGDGEAGGWVWRGVGRAMRTGAPGGDPAGAHSRLANQWVRKHFSGRPELASHDHHDGAPGHHGGSRAPPRSRHRRPPAFRMRRAAPLRSRGFAPASPGRRGGGLQQRLPRRAPWGGVPCHLSCR